jgi:hypothetical protein
MLLFETLLLSRKCWPLNIKRVEKLIMYTPNLFGEQKVLYGNVHGCSKPATRLESCTLSVTHPLVGPVMAKICKVCAAHFHVT